MHTFYTEYINHCLRFYARVYEPNMENYIFKSLVDKRNWRAVHRVLMKMNDEDKKTILEIFKRRDTLADNIYQFAKENNMEQEKIWALINRVTKQIARERGLV